ncbi:unnamed protein product [marine sediment metagenome]|uniref:Uncharacterized protein n=1 Tax=marine sediment metagenome TaxID=412755 RepID=X1T4N1_9ZZZZ
MFSLEGSGKIAKTLVYRKKKKIRDVKEYTIPVNPKTDDQKKQRNYLKKLF